MRRIASNLNCSRILARSMIENDEVLMSVLQDERDGISDLAEETVIVGISKGDTSLSKWWLSKMAKDRGFGDEPMNVTVQNNAPSKVDVIADNLDKLSEESRIAYFKICEELNNESEK